MPGASLAQSQESGGRAVLMAPAPDEQPSSPWSKPFTVSVPPAQPPRHEETQLDSWGEPGSKDRVPEVASAPIPGSDAPRSDAPGSDAPGSATAGSAKRARSDKRVRATLASRISEDVLTPAILPSRKEVQPVDTPTGWRSVEASLRSSLDRCDHLLRRGAVHSSRQEAVASLKLLFRTLDLHRQRWESELAGQQALTALKEAEDFERSSMTEPTSVQWLVQSHQTPVLRETNLESISPAIAAQHYRSYARDALITAADQHPWAADLFYALGRTYEKEAQHDVARQLTLLQHATVCFQSAFAVDARRPHISNQLGFNLLQLDRVDEANAALQASIAAKPTVNAYHNLVEVYRRTGRIDEMHWASKEAAALSVGETHYSPAQPEITEISPEEFARISPPPASLQLYQTPSEVSSRPLLPRKVR